MPKPGIKIVGIVWPEGGEQGSYPKVELDDVPLHGLESLGHQPIVEASLPVRGGAGTAVANVPGPVLNLASAFERLGGDRGISNAHRVTDDKAA